jgi:hypothetical protein
MVAIVWENITSGELKGIRPMGLTMTLYSANLWQGADLFFRSARTGRYLSAIKSGLEQRQLGNSHSRKVKTASGSLAVSVRSLHHSGYEPYCVTDS